MKSSRFPLHTIIAENEQVSRPVSVRILAAELVLNSTWKNIINTGKVVFNSGKKWPWVHHSQTDRVRYGALSVSAGLFFLKKNWRDPGTFLIFYCFFFYYKDKEHANNIYILLELTIIILHRIWCTTKQKGLLTSGFNTNEHIYSPEVKYSIRPEHSLLILSQLYPRQSY